MLRFVALRGVLLVLVAVACGGPPQQTASPAPSPSPSPTPTTPSPNPSPEIVVDCTDASLEGAEVELVEDGFTFQPDCLILLGGQSLLIRNEDAAVHNLTIEGTDVDIDTQPGQESATEPIGTVIGAGRYRFFCRFHEVQGMEGELTVSTAG
jgi:plastocyanin